MASYTVCTFLTHLEELHPPTSGPAVTGAALSTARLLKSLLSSAEIEVMEVFVPPSEFQRRDDMASIARLVLPPHRLGQGSLRFYPTHTAPDIWADGLERVLISSDTCHLARDQYLRDQYAKGPMAIHCLTHGMGQPETIESFRKVSSSRCDAISCLSTACRETVRRKLDWFANGAELELAVVRNSVDLVRFAPADAAAKQRARSLLGLPPDGVIALYFGRITPASKSDLLPLLRQFAAVSGPNDHLVIAGVENQPGYLAKCREEATRLGIGSKVLTRGAVDHELSPLLYGAADLFVFPCDNIQETFANTVAEAMACGLPVLGSRWDGLRDLVSDGETGFLVPAYLMPGLEAVEEFYSATPLMDNYLLVSQNTIVDEPMFGALLRRLLLEPEMREQMGVAGRNRIEELCDWSVIKRELFELWDRLLAYARAGGARPMSQSLSVPVRELFAEYGTLVDPTRFMIQISEQGEMIATGRASLQFYEPILSLIRSPVVDALFMMVRGGARMSLSGLAVEISQRTGVSPDVAYFHIAILVKRGALELAETEPML